MANLLVNYTNGILMKYQLEYTQDLMEPPIEVETESRMFFNEELESVYLFIPGTIAVILMLLSAMMTSISIAREKELGTMEILLVSPLKPAQIIIGKVFSLHFAELHQRHHHTCFGIFCFWDAHCGQSGTVAC